MATSISDDPAGGRSALFDRWHRSLRTVASALLARAQHAGVARPDLDVSELLALAGGIALTSTSTGTSTGTGTPQAERLLRLVREGTECAQHAPGARE
ncbi:hypothetical protein K4G22_04800 [Streptomyces profundus]|nr:hypothetical protein [Streptomyces sp. MA3_2.13]UED83610.1 hypothetical protein K4G22_04800 [Streptomyces sp. MA3_2.13]